MNSSQHLESDLYHDDKVVYKIFKNFTNHQIEKKQRKIELLHEGNPLPNVVMPIDELYFYNQFFGYTMEYIKNSIPLYEFNKVSKDIKLFLQILIIISKSFEQIHLDPRDIVIGDVNFDNIIIDRNYNPYIIDFDSCKIGELLNETNPAILNLYHQNRNIPHIDINRNSDKLSLLLWTLYMIFKKDIDRVSIYEYDKKAEHIKMLKEIRSLVVEMKKYNIIPTVPYIHEIISESDLQRKRTIQARTKKRIL